LTPSRSIAVFAANTAMFAELYVSRQNTPGQIYIYEIEMAICQASPMCLIHKIETEIVNGGSPLNLVNEYIYPTMKWNFYEYFGPQYTITNIVPNASASDLYIAGIQYDSDCIQMSQI
jgi:hypothetical protein